MAQRAAKLTVNSQVLKVFAAQTMPPALRKAVEDGVAKAAKRAVSGAIRETPMDVIEKHMAGSAYDRLLGGWKMVSDEIGSLNNIKSVFLEAAREELFFQRLALFLKKVDNATAGAMKGQIRIFENLIVRVNGEFIEDRLEHQLIALAAETPAGKICAKETAEGLSNKTAAEILDDCRVAASIKDVYQKLYHYADLETLTEFATHDASGWMLKRHDAGRYISPEDFNSAGLARGRLQLPMKKENGVWIHEPTKGRFKCIIETVDIADDIGIPRALRHSNDTEIGTKPWLEAVATDNIDCGFGGSVQFTSKRPVRVQVIDLKTGQIVRDPAHLEELTRSAP